MSFSTFCDQRQAGKEKLDRNWEHGADPCRTLVDRWLAENHKPGMSGAELYRVRIWIANRLLDLGLIEAAKWVAPER
jgi:hypothetical protein